ncbi:Scraps [Operophtera brumata]|uniref:Scraps n=1 Tax=Operophtera brumata TaxID=104452 RepID=A0A0L7LCI3_OPEBR|nr:Scraps [Operophtera brumata]
MLDEALAEESEGPTPPKVSKAVRDSDSECSGACDSELDDMLDEALAEESEGPTPPKVSKVKTIAAIERQCVTVTPSALARVTAS